MGAFGDFHKPENCSIGERIQTRAIELTNSGGHPVAGFLGARVVGVIVKPIAKIFDIVMNILTALVKLLAAVIAPRVLIVWAFGDECNRAELLKQGVIHLAMLPFHLADLIGSPFINLISPNLHPATLRGLMLQRLQQLKTIAEQTRDGNAAALEALRATEVDLRAQIIAAEAQRAAAVEVGNANQQELDQLRLIITGVNAQIVGAARELNDKGPQGAFEGGSEALNRRLEQLLRTLTQTHQELLATIRDLEGQNRNLETRRQALQARLEQAVLPPPAVDVVEPGPARSRSANAIQDMVLSQAVDQTARPPSPELNRTDRAEVEKEFDQFIEQLSRIGGVSLLSFRGWDLPLNRDADVILRRNSHPNPRLLADIRDAVEDRFKRDLTESQILELDGNATMSIDDAVITFCEKLLVDGRETLGKFLHMDEDKALELRGRLVSVQAALGSFIPIQHFAERVEAKERLDEVQRIIADMLRALPEQTRQEADWFQKARSWAAAKCQSMLAGIQNTYTQSNDPDQIRWKIVKYESQIFNYRRLVEATWPDQADRIQLMTPPDNSSHFRKAVAKMLTSLYVVGDELLVINPEDDGRLNQKYLAKVRTAHNEDFFRSLREAAEEINKGIHTSADDAELADAVSELIAMFIGGTEMEDTCFGILSTFSEMGEAAAPLALDARPDRSLAGNLLEQYRRIDAVPSSAKAPLLHRLANSLRGYMNIDFDPWTQANPVHVLYGLEIRRPGDEQAKIIKALGIGTPTTEMGRGPTVNPEFIAFLRKLEKDNKAHLYISNQDLRPRRGAEGRIAKWTGGGGDEVARSRALMELQNQPEVENSFYAVTLSKNSAFYNQKGDDYGVETMDAQIFKDALFNQFFGDVAINTGNYISEKILRKLPDLARDCGRMIEDIHYSMFPEGRGGGGDRLQLTKQQRLNFIEMFYDHLTLKLCLELDIDSFNISCKDAIDRGAASNAQLYAHLMNVNGLNEDATHQRRFESLMLVRALMVRKRPPIHERVERLTNSVKAVNAWPQDTRELFNNLYGDLSIRPLAPAEAIQPPSLL